MDGKAQTPRPTTGQHDKTLRPVSQPTQELDKSTATSLTWIATENREVVHALQVDRLEPID